MDSIVDTAIRRKKLSRPARFFLTGHIAPDHSILDYGCGLGFDVSHYTHEGHEATGYDPLHNPITLTGEFDVVTLVFVLNVIPSVKERQAVMEKCIGYATDKVLVAVRSKKEIAACSSKWKPYKDGFITGKRSFQRGYTGTELEEFLQPYGDVKIVKDSVGWVGAVIQK